MGDYWWLTLLALIVFLGVLFRRMRKPRYVKTEKSTETPLHKVNRIFAGDGIVITEFTPFNKYTVGSSVSIEGSRDHRVTVSIYDGTVHWFHFHPLIGEALYKKTEDALWMYWGLTYGKRGSRT